MFNFRVEYKPIFFIGLLLFVLGLWGPNAFGINDQIIKYCGLVLAIFGMYLANKGKKIIKN